MQERWSIADRRHDPLDADALAEVVADQMASGIMTTWFESSRGRRIALVSNGPRAMVMLLDHDHGDPGEHAVDPGAGAGSSGGFVLDNDQIDEYPDRDTVPMDEAIRIVAYLLSHGVASAQCVVARGSLTGRAGVSADAVRRLAAL